MSILTGSYHHVLYAWNISNQISANSALVNMMLEILLIKYQQILRWSIWCEIWTNKSYWLAKLSTVSWKSHQWWAHTHAWDQPTASCSQMTRTFRIFGTGYVDKVVLSDRRQCLCGADFAAYQKDYPVTLADEQALANKYPLSKKILGKLRDLWWMQII